MNPYVLLLAVASQIVPLAGSTAAPSAQMTGLHSDVVLTEYSPLSTSAELVRRLFSPLNALRVSHEMHQPGHATREQSVDLTQERFTLYVPSSTPPDGYALLVFISPGDDAIVPTHWIPVLDKHGLIFITGAKSGNSASVLDRREPIALLAVANIMQMYKVDSRRVYVGGFSGGARVALRIALGYPDVFHGALLNAGSDPIGDAQIPLPPVDLMRMFRDSTRLVYVTGADDTLHLQMDSHSRQSMREWCALNLDTVLTPHVAHEFAGATALDRALAALERPTLSNSQNLVDCRARVDGELTEQMHLAQSLIEADKLDQARALIEKIDSRYAGLASPQSLEMLQKIDARH
jgi:dienelactone hydrolase